MNKKHMKKRLLIFAAAILMIITTVTVHYKTEVRSEAAGIKTAAGNKEKNNRCHPCIQSGQLSVCYWKSSCCRSRERSGL